MTRLGGHKSLYSDAYYDEATFAALYGGTAYAPRQAPLRPEGTVPDALREGGAGSMTMTVGQAFDRVFGAEAPVRVVAWDGSDGRQLRRVACCG